MTDTERWAMLEIALALTFDRPGTGPETTPEPTISKAKECLICSD